MNPSRLIPVLEDSDFFSQNPRRSPNILPRKPDPQLYPHHKRADDAVQAGTIEWAMQKTRHWLTILDERLIGPHKTYLCGDTITLADYQGAEIISLGDLIRCKYDDYPNVSRWMNAMRNLPSWGPVNNAAEGLAASLSEQTFIAI